MNSAAIGYGTVVARLTSEEWLGPASAAAAEAVAPYVAWLTETGRQAEQAAGQARTAAAAYEAALAAAVPALAVTANRSQQQTLIATNVLGQNTPAIAATEAQYGAMWAQDAAAMYGYAGAAAAAAKVTPFVSPQPATNPAGQSGQAIAVAHAAGTSQTAQLLSSLQKTLGSLALPTSAASSTGQAWESILGGVFGTNWATDPLGSLVNLWTTYVGPVQSSIAIAHFSTGAINSGLAIQKALAPAAAAAKAVSDGAQAAGAALPAAAGLGGGVPIAAGLGGAASVGRLSVPPVWTALGSAPLAAPSLPISAIPVSGEAANAGNLLGGMPLAGAAAGAGGGAGPKYGFRPTIMARPPSAG